MKLNKRILTRILTMALLIFLTCTSCANWDDEESITFGCVALLLALAIMLLALPRRLTEGGAM